MAIPRDDTLRQPLTENEAPEPHRRSACTVKVLGVGSLAVATLALLTLCSSGSLSTPWIPQQSQLAGVFEVEKFNTNLETIKLVDAENTFKALPKPQIEALFEDFLGSIGSTAPRSSGTFQRDIGPRNSFETPEEHAYRLKVFATNLLTILHQNAKAQRNNPNDFRAVFGITEFADWTHGEFKLMRSMSGRNITKVDEEMAKESRVTHNMLPEGLDGVADKGKARRLAAPTETCGLHYPVRNQGHCGDCWAFSTAEVIRMRLYRESHVEVGPLSAQQLVDCYPGDLGDRCSEGVNGCCGGLPIQAINYLHQTGGLATKATYGPNIAENHPFTGERCKSVPKAVLPGVGIQIKSEEVMAQYLCQYGAISVAIDASPLNAYRGGVLTAAQCPNQVDHAILVIGIDSSYFHYSNGAPAPVWVVQNSWGVNWGVASTRPYRPVSGNSGFFILLWGTDTCHVADYAVIPSSATRIR